EAVARSGGGVEEGVGGGVDLVLAGDRQRATRLAGDRAEVGVAQLEDDCSCSEAALIEPAGDALRDAVEFGSYLGPITQVAGEGGIGADGLAYVGGRDGS